MNGKEKLEENTKWAFPTSIKIYYDIKPCFLYIKLVVESSPEIDCYTYLNLLYNTANITMN